MCLMYGAGRMNSNRGCKASPCTITCLSALVHSTVLQLFMYRSFCIDTHESCDTTYRSAANVPDLMYSIFVHALVVLYNYPCAEVQ